MADGGMIGNGVKAGYRIVDSPLAAFTEIGQLLNVEGIDLNADKISKTTHSTSRFKRHFGGMIEVSDLVMEILANPDEASGEGVVQAALHALLISGENVNWRIEKPVDRTQSAYKGYSFDGSVIGVSPLQVPMDGPQVFRLTVVFDDSTFTVDTAGASEL